MGLFQLDYISKMIGGHSNNDQYQALRSKDDFGYRVVDCDPPWKHTMVMYKIRICKNAEKEHKLSKRQYAHTYHYPKTICVSDTIFYLPSQFLWGILLHEVGHLLGGLSEEGANKKVKERFGVKVWYKNSKEFGERLEWLSKTGIEKLKIVRDGKFLSIKKHY